MAKILIMDDEEGLRNVIFNMLKPTGHTLFLTEDGKQAIETAKRENPDLALLDMRVPDYDGLEVLAELKKMNPNIKCIMLSGFGDVETAVAAIKKGAFDYLSKPFKVDEVLSVVNKALSQKIETVPMSPESRKPQEKPKLEVPSTYIPPKKFPVPLVAGIGAAVLMLLVVIFLIPSGGVITYKIAYSNPTSLTFDGKNLWISDWVSKSIYRHKTDKALSVESVVSFPEYVPLSIVWDGRQLWSCDGTSGLIVQHANNQHLTQVASFRMSVMPSVMGFDGTNLWFGDNEGKVYKFIITPQGLVPAGGFATTAQQLTAIFFYDRSIWLGDAETRKIYRYDPTNFSLQGMYILKPYDRETERFSGIIYDGKYLWSAVDGKNKIYRHNLAALKKI